MVKPDVKHNYYNDLDLPATATVDDVRKAYRKLALQYHPDRNAGREAECVPRFQAIQAANEVLSDAIVKAKYDQDRRKASLYPSPKPNPGPTGHPYQAASDFPPPPRRTQPGTWTRPTSTFGAARPPPAAPPPGPAPTGADRFTNFPRPQPPPRKDPTADRTQQFRAWQNMNNPERARPPNRAAPPPQPPQRPPRESQPGAAPTRPRAPGQEIKMPTEEQIRAGMRYGGAAGPNQAYDPDSAEARKSAWQAFQQHQQQQQPPPPPPQQTTPSKPGLGRSNTNRTPRRPGGFDPNAAGPDADEGPAPEASHHYSHRHRSEDLGSSNGLYPPPPPGPPPIFGTDPKMSPDASTQKPAGTPKRPPYKSRTTDADAPYSEGNRKSTPYTSFIGEKTRILSDGLRRSASTRDTTKLQPESESTNATRARSNSPVGRQQPASTEAPPPRKPFVPYDSSDDSDSDGIDLTRTPEEVDSKDGTAAAPASKGSAPSGSHDRPKKVPKPRNRERPDMQQRQSGQNMYAYPFSSRAAFLDSWTSTHANGAMGRTVDDSANREYGGRIVHTPIGEITMVEKDPLWPLATIEERGAFCIYRSQLRSNFGIDSELSLATFLLHALAVRNGKHLQTPGHDEIMRELLLAFPLLGTFPQQAHTTDHFVPARFNFPPGQEAHPAANGPNRSEERINTDFAAQGFSGQFVGSPDHVPPASPSRKGSPALRHVQRQRGNLRSATTDATTPSPLFADNVPPPRKFGSDGTHLKASPLASTSPEEATFDPEQHHFPDASWAWPPSEGNSGVKSKRTRSTSNKAKSGRTAANVSAGSQQDPHVVEDDEDDEDNEDGGSETEAKWATQPGPPVVDDADAMDIDTPPQAGTTSGPTPPHPPTHTATSGGSHAWRGSWRESPSTNGYRKSAGSTRRPQDSKLKVNLDDLAQVEPMVGGGTDASGGALKNLADLAATLPFESKAADVVAKKPAKLDVPAFPVHPPVPHRLTKSSWKSLADAFGRYVKEFHIWNHKMLDHFNTRERTAEARIVGGMEWLEAVGETTSSAAPGGIFTYLREVQEDEQVRMAWNVGWEKHGEALKEFEKVRERVMELVQKGALAET